MFIITGRPDYLYDITKKWVDRFYTNATLVLVGRKTMIHADDCKTGWLVLAKLKADKIIKLGLDIYFDDEPETIIELRRLCPNTKIIYYGGRIEI